MSRSSKCWLLIYIFFFLLQHSSRVVCGIWLHLLSHRRLLVCLYLFLLNFHAYLFLTLIYDRQSTAACEYFIMCQYLSTYLMLVVLSLQTFYWIFVQHSSRAKVKLSPIPGWLLLTICVAGLLSICWRRCRSIICMHRIYIMARWVVGA